MEDSLQKRYIIKLLSNLLNGIVNIIIVAMIPKALGPVAFGYFTYLQQFFNQFIAFLDAGTSTAFFTKLSSNNSRKELIMFYGVFSFILLVILYLAMYIFHYFDSIDIILPNIPSEYIYYGVLFGFFTWLSQVVIKISDAYALTVSVELVKIIHRIASLILILYMVNYLPFDLNIYYYFHFIALLSFILIVAVVFVKKDIISKKLFINKMNFRFITKEFYIFSSPLFVFNSVAILVALFDIWLLQKFSGSEQTGFYGLAYSIAAMSILFTSAMTPIISREFSKAYGEKNIELIKELFKKYVPSLYLLSTYFSVFIFFESEVLLDIFTDDRFSDVLPVLIIMSLYPIHQTYGQISGSVFFAMNNTKIYRNIGLAVSLGGILLSLFFIVYLNFGALGLALKMVVIQFIGVNIQLYYNCKSLNMEIGYYLYHQFYTFCLIMFLAWISTIIILTESNILNFLFSGFIYTILISILIYLYPNIISTRRENIKFFLGE